KIKIDKKIIIIKMIERGGSLAELINKDEYMKINHFKKNHQLIEKTKTYQKCILHESHHSLIKGFNYDDKNNYQLVLNKNELIIKLNHKKNIVYVDSVYTYDYEKDIHDLIYQKIDKNENIELIYPDKWIED